MKCFMFVSLLCFLASLSACNCKKHNQNKIEEIAKKTIPISIETTKLETTPSVKTSNAISANDEMK